MKPEWWDEADTMEIQAECDWPGDIKCQDSKWKKFGLCWELQRQTWFWIGNLYLLVSQMAKSTQKVQNKKNPTTWTCTQVVISSFKKKRM